MPASAKTPSPKASQVASCKYISLQRTSGSVHDLLWLKLELK